MPGSVDKDMVNTLVEWCLFTSRDGLVHRNSRSVINVTTQTTKVLLPASPTEEGGVSKSFLGERIIKLKSKLRVRKRKKEGLG